MLGEGALIHRNKNTILTVFIANHTHLQKSILKGNNHPPRKSNTAKADIYMIGQGLSVPVTKTSLKHFTAH